jgi:hypothetical protein
MRGGKQPAVDGSGPGFGTPGVGGPETFEQRVDYYRRVEEAENIEIQKTDQTKKNSDAGGTP